MKKQQAYILVASIGILLIGGVFLVWKTKHIPRPEQITQKVDQPVKNDEIASVRDLIDGEYTFEPIDTSDWQTYRNEEVGFEVRVPKLIKNVDKQSFIDNSGKAISFYVTPYERMQKKRLNDVFERDFFDPTFIPFIDTGNIEVSFRKMQVNGVQINLVKYLFKKEPKNHNIEVWNEGYNVEEVFFQCKLNVCSVKTFSDQFFQEKQVLFYTILSTLRLIE